MDEHCFYTDGAPGGYEGPEMGFLAMPPTQGAYVEVEPPRKRFHSGNDQRVLLNTEPTPRKDRASQYGANQLLNNQQIQNFITSTVLPLHLTLINSGGIKWSNNLPENRPTQQRFQRKVENLHPAYVPYAMELINQTPGQFNPLVTYDAQREAKSKDDVKVGKVASLPRGICIPQAIQDNVISIPERLGEPPEEEEDEEEIIIIMEGTPNEILCNTSSQGLSVTKEMTYIPQGIRVPQETLQDNVIYMPQGFSVTQGKQEEITPIPQGIRTSQQKQENIICMSQGFTIPQGTDKDIIPTTQGIIEPQQTADDIFTFILQGINIPQGSTFDEITFASQGTNIPLGKQRQDLTTYDLNNNVDRKGPIAPVHVDTTHDVSPHNQPGSTNLPRGSVPQIETTQTEVQEEQTLKKNSVDNVQTQRTNTITESPSQFSIAERSRAIAAEVFREAAQYVAQENVDRKSRLEVTSVHEHEMQTSSTRQPNGKRKRVNGAVVENAINESPMKRHKVDMEATDIKYQTYKTESESSKKVLSKNNAEEDELMQDAVKILQRLSSDIFPENIINQIFKDTFESDIFLTSGDEFVMDSLLFFNSEFEQDVDSL